jgi:ankyrin repeat protein
MKDNQYECSYCGNFTRHADASDSDHTGITALHAAVQKEGHLDVVVALLEHGADVDCQTAKV